MELPALGDLVEHARREGAKGSEFLWSAATGRELVVRRGQKADHSEHADECLRVTVWLEGGREGRADGPVEDASGLIERALAQAGDAPESSLNGPVDRLRPVVGGLGIYDRRYEHLDHEGREEVLLDGVRAARAEDKRVTPKGFRYRDELRLRRFANSRGVVLEEQSTRYDAYGTVELGSLTLSDHIAARTFASIASFPYGTALARRAAALSVDGERLDGVVKAMLPPRVVARIMESIGDAFLPSRVSGEEPFFLARLEDGAAPVDPRLHLLDDGRLPGGLRTRSFDDRGVVPAPLTLMREGAADQALVDPEAARRHSLTPTGHVRGDAVLSGNLALRAGTRSMNATYTDHDAWCLEVDDLDLSKLDLATGVATVVLNGRVMKSNVCKGAMRQQKARVDLKRMLSNVLQLCSDTDRIRYVDAPALFVDGLELL